MSIQQGEHSFESEVLISGEQLPGYTAAEALTAGEPVYITGDYEVSPSTAGEGAFMGVALYDVAAGEEIAIASDDTEVRIPVSESVSAGDELLPDGAGGFETVATSAGSSGIAIVEEGASAGERCDAFIKALQGATA